MELLFHLLVPVLQAVHALLGNPLLDIGLIGLSFLSGRWTGGIGLFMRVAILVIRMAVHFYSTHPQGMKARKTTQIDNHFAKLYKEHVAPLEHKLKETHETGASG